MWLPILCVIALAGCAYELVRNGAVNQTRADEIQVGIQKIRELSFEHPVPLVLETRDQAEAALIADINRDYTDEELQADGHAGALIGLFPAGIDLKAEMVRLLKSEVAGFYDPHGKRMIMVEGAANFGIWTDATEFLLQRDLVGEMLLAHEYTHALQDQHFGLEAALDKIKDNDDRSLALKSVAEGDATLAGFAYVAGAMNDETADQVTSRLEDLPGAFAAETKDAPEGLSAPLIFQYSEGAKFVSYAYHRGGWDAVNALYRQPPQSSQQIMHPELYFDRPTLPDQIELAGYKRTFSGWEEVEDNCLGELLLQVIIQRNLGKQSPALALTDRWSGDRMLTMRKGQALTIIWMLSFSDDHSAAQFAGVYVTLLDRMLGQSTAHRVDYHNNA
ncbi:MAG TPA: hypothetical protein VMB26_09460, partial [Candidatus Binataceae bacterium]|nr:hypothetical protein [Candidatus Binataceae bacterium]